MRFIKVVFLIVLSAWGVVHNTMWAHPMPNSLVLLSIEPRSIRTELRLPLVELELAFGKPLAEQPDSIILSYKAIFTEYILRHVKPYSTDSTAWHISEPTFAVQSIETSLQGIYKELIVKFDCTPPTHKEIRDFILRYDVILHQVVTHSAIVAVRSDWDAGILHTSDHDTSTTTVGVIAWDIRPNTLAPFRLPPIHHGLWIGFRTMFFLGMNHISEGIDHLMFLVVLLIPAPLLIIHRSWGHYGGLRYALVDTVRVVTAFTIGHSLSLLYGTFAPPMIPPQWIELCIAGSIAVSALHAARPLITQGMVWIAIGFGLIHGLAFSQTLSTLEVDTQRLFLSVAGFNIGIEVFQLLLVTLTMPCLILLSQTRYYTPFRFIMAGIAGCASIAWGMERWSGQNNTLTSIINTLPQHPKMFVLLWCTFTLFVFGVFLRERIIKRKQVHHPIDPTMS